MTSKTVFSPEPHRGWLPWGLLAPVLSIAFVIAGALIPELWMEARGFLTPDGEPKGLAGWYAFLVIPFALTGLIVVAWTRFVERRPLATIGLRGGKAVSALPVGILVGAAMILALVGAIGLAGGYGAAGVGPAWASPAALTAIGLMLLCFVVQSGVEEFMFRGWLLSAVTRKLGLPLGILLSSLVFTFLHWSPGQPWVITLSSFMFSVFACAWAIRAGHVWGVMGWHAGWNWLLGIGFELPVTGLDVGLPVLLVKLVPEGPVLLTGGAQGPEGSWLACLLFAGGAAAIWLWPRKPARLRDAH